MPDPRYIPTPAPRPAPSLFDAQAEADEITPKLGREFVAAEDGGSGPPHTLAVHAARREDELRAIQSAVSVSADDVGQLRRADVFRVLEWSPAELRPAVANYVREHRPDLSAEVGAALLELENVPS